VIIPLVEAVTILGQEVSMLVLTPVILILIFLIFFIFMIIRDKIRDKRQAPEFSDKSEPLPKETVDEKLSLDEGLSLDSELPLDENTTKGRDILKTPKQPQKPKTNYLKEVELIKRKLSSKNIEETNKKLNDLVKKFFSEYAGINYKFTFEELEKELKKRNKKVVCFSDNLSSINYSPKGASHDDVIELINEFKDIIEATSEEELQAIPKFRKETEEKKKRINMLLKKGEKLIEKDINQARENYNEILTLYETLISKEKATIRPMVLNFYNKLKS